MIKEIYVKSALYKLKTNRFPYNYDLNLYKGCSHGCKYCYARSTYSKYQGKENNFQTDIFVKKNIAKILDTELSKKDYTTSFINLGGVCDSYQPIEKKYELMREVLKVLIKHKQPIMFSTKSKLILRDLDLIDELSKLAKVVIGICITTSDSNISKKIEPGASLPEERFLAMKELKENTNATVGLHILPVIPFLSDIDNGLEKIFKWGLDANVDYVLMGLLHLRGDIRSNVFPVIKKDFPEYYDSFIDIYEKDFVKRGYKYEMYSRLDELRKKYGLKKYPKFDLESKKKNLELF